MPSQIRFLGAAGEVTGSCHLLESAGRRVLLDCGLYQGSKESEARNHLPFPFDPKSIDAVILSHAHLDHAGRLPLLVKRGYRGPIYTHPATRDLSRIMLMDAAHLAANDAETQTRKAARRGLPAVTALYGLREVQQCLAQFQDLHYQQRTNLLPGMDCRLQDAGHILGAAVVELWIEGSGPRCKLVFSGDLGQGHSFIMPPPAPVQEADLVVMESVYGDRRHKTPESTVRELAEIVRTARAEGGNILIPAFCVGRAQELLYLFAQNFHAWGLSDWALFLDSPMAIDATNVYTAHALLLKPDAASYARSTGFNSQGVHYAATTDESIAISRIARGAIVIAGSGMCNGGRILHHLKHRLWRRNTHVVFVGFQAAGTLGRRLVDGAREVSLWGEPIHVAAQIHTLGGFSAHADQKGLCDWYSGFLGHPRVALVHGEPKSATALATELRTRYGCPVIVPAQGDTIDLDAKPTSASFATDKIA